MPFVLHSAVDLIGTMSHRPVALQVLGVVQERSFLGIPKRLPYRFSAFVLSFEDRRRRAVCVREQRRCIRYLLSLLGRLGLLSRRSADSDVAGAR